MSKFIELNRTFLRVPSALEDFDPELVLHAARAENNSMTWEELLAHPVVVVFGEGGTGKSTELKAREKVLRERGCAAFFIALEELAANDPADCFDFKDAARYVQWIGSATSDAYFFLDSLDEAKLKGKTLSAALRRLNKALKGRRNAVRIVLSCRASDWAPISDRHVLGESLPAGQMPIMVQIDPLNDAQVHAIARNEGIIDWQEFGAAISSASAHAFAERPLDVIWLTKYWRDHGKLGQLRELVEHNVQEKLKERYGRRSTLAPESAREGLEGLAGVATLANERRFLIPDDGPNTSEQKSCIDPRSALPTWGNDAIAELLSLAIFDEATYGRIRIHHRIVHEYLTASWLRSLIASGLSRAMLYDLLFCESSGRRLVRPHLVATVGWLCLWDSDLKKRILRIAPEILIGEGDPSGLSPEDRQEALRAYGSKFQDRERLYHFFDSASLGRFATEQLANTINTLIDETDAAEELVVTLLNIVKEGRLANCSTHVLKLAIGPETSDHIRYAAITTLEEVGAKNHIAELLAWVDASAAVESETAAALLRTLFPDALDVDRAISLLSKVRPSPANRFDALDSFLGGELFDRTPLHRKDYLVDALVTLIAPTTKKIEDIELIEDNRWLLRPLATIVATQLEQFPDDAPRSVTTQRALALFRYCNEQGFESGYGLSEVRRAISASSETRRQLFWQVVEERRASKNRCTHYLDIIDGYRLYELSNEDTEWLMHDALSRPNVQDRLLAFDTLWSRPQTEEEQQRRPSLLKPIVDADPALRKRFERMLNPRVTYHPALKRYDLRHRARAIRLSRTRDANKQKLEDVIATIESGENLSALHFLYREASHDHSNWSRIKLDGIAEHYGVTVSKAFRSGTRAFWRTVDPLMPHEREERRSTPMTHILGLAGATLEFDEGLVLASLNDSDLERLVRYATCELNGFPSWLSSIAECRPQILATTMASALAADYNHPNDGTSINDVLAKLPGADAQVRQTCLPVLTQLLAHADPPAVGTLLMALETVLASPSDKSEVIDTLFEGRCRAHVGTPERFAAWWVAWLVRKPKAAMNLLDEFSAIIECPILNNLVLEICHRIYEWSDTYSVVPMPPQLAPDILRRLIPLVLAAIHDNDDIRHEGVYSPGKRDHAQTIRGRLLNSVTSLEGEESAVALRSLAEDPRVSEYRDWFLSRADAHSASSAPCAPLQISAALLWEQGIAKKVENDAELFKVALSRLDDIRLAVEQDDHSIRAVYTAAKENVQESHAQNFLTQELRRRSLSQYTVHREEEADRFKKPDIRIANSCCAGPVSVEVKVAEKWTFNELVEALGDQLVSKYLRATYSRQGILLLCAMGPSRNWRDNDSRKLLSFPELIKRLNELGTTLREHDPNIDSLVVFGIDFH